METSEDMVLTNDDGARDVHDPAHSTALCT